MKKIIVATDYAPEAENALQYAAAAAAAMGYELVLFSLQNASIHVLNARLPADILNAHITAKKEYLKEKAKIVHQKFGIDVTPYFATGVFFDELKRCIAHTDADLVVMGMAPHSIEQDVMGNTTTAALRQIMVPVLAVPTGASYNGIRHILFACDLLRGVHKQILKRVHDIAGRLGARVEIFSVGDVVKKPADDHRKDIDESMAGIPYYYHDIASDDVIGAIKEEITAQKADLLIMVPYQYGFWSSLIHKSKTRLMAAGNSIPLLALHL